MNKQQAISLKRELRGISNRLEELAKAAELEEDGEHRNYGFITHGMGVAADDVDSAIRSVEEWERQKWTAAIDEVNETRIDYEPVRLEAA